MKFKLEYDFPLENEVLRWWARSGERIAPPLMVVMACRQIVDCYCDLLCLTPSYSSSTCMFTITNQDGECVGYYSVTGVIEFLRKTVKSEHSLED